MAQTNTPEITIESSILIQRDPITVFNYVSDLRLDKHWRKEINETTLVSPALGLGSRVVESSFLSKRVPANEITLTCSVYSEGEKIVYQSVPESAFNLMNSRSVTVTSPGITRFTYLISFDAAIVKFGLGFQLPRFLVMFYTRKTMGRYLAKLKTILESQN
jgi:hypothetical protein